MQTTEAGIRVSTHHMVDYKAILSYLTEQKLHQYAFCPQMEEHLKAIIYHVPINNFSQDITPSLHELHYVISVKQMTTRNPSPDGSLATFSLTLFLVTLTRSQKSKLIFTFTSPSSLVIKVEVYKTQTGLKQCYNYQRFGHVCVHCMQNPRCLF